MPKWIFQTVIIFSAAVIVFSLAKIPTSNTSNKFATSVPKLTNPVHTIIAAGDISCPDLLVTSTQCQQSATANLIAQNHPDLVLAIGDLQYNGSSVVDYQNYYDKSWGQFKTITRPVLGNEDNAQGYYQYFGVQAGEAGKGYYSFDLGDSWHLVALNSNCWETDGCGTQGQQYKWLENDLVKNTKPCVLAYFHHPLYSSGLHGNNDFVKSFWQLLYRNHADLVLNGHDHVYERFAPQDPNGQTDKNGIREFIVGTGGRNLYNFPSVQPNSENRNNQTFGVLKLFLQSKGYSWQFMPITGQNFSDSGSSNCHK